MRNVKKVLKILLGLFFIVVIVGIILSVLFLYKYIEMQKSTSNYDDVDRIYNIYNNDNRQEIVNQYTDDNSLGVPTDDGTLAIATLEIPSINFKNIVVEGTTQNDLSKGIGLFEHSNILDGNVCLAGHNSNKLLANLKNVKEGDIIKYSSCLGNKTYKVSHIEQIEETNWSLLENTPDNRLTIITCVKGISHLRLCVQAKEVK